MYIESLETMYLPKDFDGYMKKLNKITYSYKMKYVKKDDKYIISFIDKDIDDIILTSLEPHYVEQKMKRFYDML